MKTIKLTTVASIMGITISTSVQAVSFHNLQLGALVNSGIDVQVDITKYKDAQLNSQALFNK